MVVATLTEKIDFEMYLTVEQGRGYRPAAEYYQDNEEQEIGVIPIDAIFSPVQRVRFRTEDTRVGQRTNYDRLVLDIWSDGTVSPEMSLVEAAKILRKHLNPFVQFDEAGGEVVSTEVSSQTEADMELMRKLQMPVADLDLSVRAGNCLESAQLAMLVSWYSETKRNCLGFVPSAGRRFVK